MGISITIASRLDCRSFFPLFFSTYFLLLWMLMLSKFQMFIFIKVTSSGHVIYICVSIRTYIRKLSSCVELQLSCEAQVDVCFRFLSSRCRECRHLALGSSSKLLSEHKVINDDVIVRHMCHWIYLHVKHL